MNAPMTKAEIIAAGNVSVLTQYLRTELKRNLDNIPEDLKRCKCWLVWKVTEIKSTTGKFNKIPIYPRSRKWRHGTQGSEADIANLGTFEEAIAALEAEKSLAGIGVALLPSFELVALDVDRCVENGSLREDVAQLTNTYCEISPSGTGIRAFWRGSASDGKNHETGYELFHAKSFVTVTGNRVENVYSFFCPTSINELDPEMQAKLEDLSRALSKTGNDGLQSEATGKAVKVSTDEKLKAAAANDSRLQAIKAAELYERDLGNGKHSIRCPFEDQHSDAGRKSGDGDTVYFQPHTNGYAEGFIFCHHSHGNNQNKYWAAIGYDIQVEDFENLNFEDWPNPLPLPEDSPPVPELEPSMLPDALRPYIEDIAERMQISLDIPAIGLITALSAVVGRRIQIKPKQYDDWTVVPNLWGAVIAPPGFMKSPALTEAVKPLYHQERIAYQKYKAQHREWEIEKECIEVKNKAIKSDLKKNTKEPVDEIQPISEEPIPVRYCVNNFSLEALGEVLIGNPYGVLVFNDELYGLLKLTEKKGNEGLHEFLLSAWNGDSPFTFDRIGRGLNRRIDHTCVSVLGGIQPGRLKEYVSATVQGKQGDSGLLQRFQLMVWPDQKTDWELVDREPDQQAEQAVHRIFERIVGADAADDFDDDSPVIKEVDIRRFDAEAQGGFYKFLEDLERTIRDNSLPPVLISHLAKYRSLVPSLALIFSIADDVKGKIPLRYVELAIRWSEYLRAHAERVFACGTYPDTRYARALLDKIIEGAVADKFKPADVYQKGWRLLDRDGVSKATNMLCDFDYLLRIDKKPNGGGRPSTTYLVNPKIKFNC